MKRSIQVVGGLGLALGVALGAAPSASAHEQKPKHAEKSTCATHCRPTPTPPAGGWPCRLDHSCASKHHYKPCPPVKPPTKPPVLHPTPKPPAVTKPKPHHVPATPVARAVPNTPQLALTGVDPLPLLLLSGGLIGGGSLLLLTGPIRKFTRKAKR